MNKNSTVIVGLLSLFLLFLQAALFLMILLIVGPLLFIVESRQLFADIFLKTVDLSHSSLPPEVYLGITVGFMLITILFLFLYLKSIRHLLLNINDKRYFEEKNLKLIKFTLIFYILYTLSNFGMDLVHQLFQIKQLPQMIDNNLYSMVSVVDGLMTVLAIYVIYLVFKQGFLLRRENQSII